MTNNSHVVVITAPFEPAWLARLQSLWPDLRIEHLPARSGVLIPENLWQVMEILYTSFSTSLPLPEQAPRLRWVQLYSAGIDRIVSQPLFHTSVVFTSASG